MKRWTPTIVKVILDGGMLDKPTVADLLKAEQNKNRVPSVDDADYDIYAEADDWNDLDDDPASESDDEDNSTNDDTY